MNRYQQKIAQLCNPDADEINLRGIKPTSESELQNIESEMGCSLPDDYREFLRDYGGIYLGANSCRLAALYHLSDSHFGRASLCFAYNANELLESLKDAPKHIPSELITIGEDGNVRLYLAISGLNAGSVYQWYPSNFPENLYYYPELELVTRSFDDFIHKLMPLEEGYYDNPEYYEQEKQQTKAIVEALSLIGPIEGNAYSKIMSELGGCYVYATLGEKPKNLSETDLQNLEQEFGHPLPADYREFLRSFGGYSFIPSPKSDGCFSQFPNFHHSPGFRNIDLKFFHGQMGNDYHDLSGHYQRLKGYLPNDMLPIANAGGVCLKLSGDNKGTIYRANPKVTEFNSEYCVHYDQLQENSMTVVASSFDEFIRSSQTVS